MVNKLFFCEFKKYIVVAFDTTSLDLNSADLDCIFDIYENYLDSDQSIYDFVNSKYNYINARINLI